MNNLTRIIHELKVELALRTKISTENCIESIELNPYVFRLLRESITEELNEHSPIGANGFRINDQDKMFNIFGVKFTQGD